MKINMVGVLRETYFGALPGESDESQKDLFAYATNDKHTTATIAVVSRPHERLLDATDEYMPELGMPPNVLEQFQQMCDSLDDSDGERTPIEVHNDAYDRLDLDTVYRGYIESDEEAQDRVHEIIERVAAGKNITFVCFEKPPKNCHRYTLKSYIEERIQTISV